jgi:phosphomannomutase
MRGIMKIYSADECDARQCLDLGMAIGAWLGHNGMIMTGTDGKPVSRLVRRALTVGLAGMGVTVLDMRMVPEVVVGYEVKKQGMGAGLYVAFDGARFHVSIYKSDGEPLDQATVQKILALRGQPPAQKLGIMDLGTILYYPNGIEDYIDSIYSEISFRKPVSVLVDCQTTPIAALIPGLFERYGIKATLFNGLVSGYGTPKPKEEFLATLKRERFHLGLRFLDAVEIYDGHGNKVDERHGIKEVLLYLRDLPAPGNSHLGGRA